MEHGELHDRLEAIAIIDLICAMEAVLVSPLANGTPSSQQADLPSESEVSPQSLNTHLVGLGEALEAHCLKLDPKLHLSTVSAVPWRDSFDKILNLVSCRCALRKKR